MKKLTILMLVLSLIAPGYCFAFDDGLRPGWAVDELVSNEVYHQAYAFNSLEGAILLGPGVDDPGLIAPEPPNRFGDTNGDYIASLLFVAAVGYIMGRQHMSGGHDVIPPPEPPCKGKK